MSEFSRPVMKLLPVAVLASVALGGSAVNEQFEPIALGTAPAALKEAYASCGFGDDIGAFKLVSKEDDKITVQFPLDVEKNPAVANDPESGIAYRGLVVRAHTENPRTTPLFGKPSDISYDEQKGIATHTIPLKEFEEDAFTDHDNLVLTVSARVEETRRGPRRVIDRKCADIVVRPDGVEPTTHTAQGGLADFTETIVHVPFRK